MNIVIATTKSWNLKRSKKLKEENKEWNITIICDKEELTLSRLTDINPEFVFFPHWSYIIPKEIYSSFECVVFHMTDLPYGRGGSPLQNLIVRGHQETVISALKVEKGLDTGPIYMKTPLSLSGRAEEIYDRASDIIFSYMIPELVKNHPTPVEQAGEAVIFSRRKPEQSELTDNMSLHTIYDYIRMLDAEGYPNAFLEFGQNTLLFSHADMGVDQQGEYIEAKVRIRRK